MKTAERKALSSYLTAIADALMADMNRDQRNYLTGYASAHLASVAGLLSVAGSSDLAGPLDRDREQFNGYVVKLLNSTPATVPVTVEDGAKITALHDVAAVLNPTRRQ